MSKRIIQLGAILDAANRRKDGWVFNPDKNVWIRIVNGEILQVMTTTEINYVLIGRKLTSNEEEKKQ